MEGGDLDDFGAPLLLYEELTHALDAQLQARSGQSPQVPLRPGGAAAAEAATQLAGFNRVGNLAAGEAEWALLTDNSTSVQGAIALPQLQPFTTVIDATRTAAAAAPTNVQTGRVSSDALAADGSSSYVLSEGGTSSPPVWDAALAGEGSAAYSLLKETTTTTDTGEQQRTHRTPLLPGWRQQVQHEAAQALAGQRREAAQAADAAKRLRASRHAGSWQAAQQQLPFRPTNSNIAGAKHRLQKSLSNMLRGAGASAAGVGEFPAGALDTACVATAAEASIANPTRGTELEIACVAPATGHAIKQRTVVPLLDKFMQTTAATAQQAQQRLQHSAVREPQQSPVRTAHQQAGECRPVNCRAAPADGAKNANSQTPAAAVARGRCSLSSSSSGRASTPKRQNAPPKAEQWAAADAATDAEVLGYLKDHWQQQHLPAAALVLQCAWRSRGPRLMFNRYMLVRQRNAASALGPAFNSWQQWTLAEKHCRYRAQQQTFLAWKELLALQLDLCNKVVQALQRGVLSGEVADLLAWRMCTPLNPDDTTRVKPSLGGLLASLLKQREPRMKLQVHFCAWLTYHQGMQATRAEAQRLLAAAVVHWRKGSARACLRFWHMYTTAALCDRLGLAMPVFRPHMPEFEEWLWQHERGKQLKQQAAALFEKRCLVKTFGGWRTFVHKVCTMRLAWSGLMLVSPAELLRHGMSAFKANWKEQKRQRELLRLCFSIWLDVSKRNKSVAIMRRRIQQAAEHQSKYAAVQAFKRHTNMSLLISNAASIKIWQARPLVLGHLHAWLGDSLHMTFYLLWWRWRHRAVAQLRFRAALGLHMYRAHWLDLELAFSAWRKVTAVARPSKTRSGQDSMQLKHTGGAALVILSGEESIQAVGLGPYPEGSQRSTAAALGPNTPALAARSAGPALLAEAETGPVQADATLAETETQQLGRSMSPSAGTGEQLQDAALEKEDGQEVEEAPVFVSLADFPAGPPWRPLAHRADVMALRGLQHLSGARLAKAVRDLRELEGRYIIKDKDRGAEGLIGSMVYNKRRTVSPGLRAMVRAQLPMSVLWRATSPEDSMWWQRLTGMLQQHIPHPDSWKCFISSYNSTKHSRTVASKQSSSRGMASQPQLQPEISELHDLLHGSCCRVQQAPAISKDRNSNTSNGSHPASGASAGKGRSQPFKVTPLLLSDQSEAPSAYMATARSNGNAAIPGSADRRVQIITHSGDTGGNHDGGVDGDCSWPAQWSALDVAWLSQLVQAEELLETTVHMMLGIGADSTEELYQKLAHMTRGQGLDMQGDLLTWLLSTAVAHDSAHARGVLLKARARDELVIATMEMRQRAIALHLNFPWKFTLDSQHPVADVHAAWADAIRKVEEERDWDDSSVDSDDGIWTELILKQQQHPSQSAEQINESQWQTACQQAPADNAHPTLIIHDGTSSLLTGTDAAQPRPSSAVSVRSESPTTLGRRSSLSPGELTASGPDSGTFMRPVSRWSPHPAAAAAIAAAAGASLPVPEAPALFPGGMLSQTKGSGELHRVSFSKAQTLEQQQLQQQFAADIKLQEEAAKAQHCRREQRAKERQQQKRKAAMVAAKGLIGAGAVGPPSAAGLEATAAAGQPDLESAMGEVFTVPMYASLSGMRGSTYGGVANTNRPGTAGRISAVPSDASNSGLIADSAGNRPPSRANRPSVRLLTEHHEAFQSHQQKSDEGSAVHGMYNASGSSNLSAGLAQANLGNRQRTASAGVRPNSRSACSSKEAVRTVLQGNSRPITGTRDHSQSAVLNTHTRIDGVTAASAATRNVPSLQYPADIQEELKTVIQTVLAPAQSEGPAANEAQEAAVELAEACVQYIQEQQQQHSYPTGEPGSLAAHTVIYDDIAGGEADSSGLPGEQYITGAGSPFDPALASASRPHSSSSLSGKEYPETDSSTIGNIRQLLSPGSTPMSLALQAAATASGRVSLSSKLVGLGSTAEPLASLTEDMYASAALSAAFTSGLSSSAPERWTAARSSGGSSGLSVGRGAAVHDDTALRSASGQGTAQQCSTGTGRQAVPVSVVQQQQQQASVAVPGLKGSCQQMPQPQQHQVAQQQQQQHQQLEREISSCSSTSSLPSIPSCTEALQPVKHSTNSSSKRLKAGMQLPAIVPATGTSQRLETQRPATGTSQRLETQREHGVDYVPYQSDFVAAANARREAVWRAPAAPVPEQQGVASRAGRAASSTPSLQALLQESVKEDWQDFELIAQELMAGLSAALQARYATSAAAQVAPTAAPPAPMQELGGRQASDSSPAAADPVTWHSQPDMPATLSLALSAEASAVAERAAVLPGQVQQGLAGMVSKLMVAPLAARYTFWRQVIQKGPQGLSRMHANPSTSSQQLASQLHQLAWSSLLQRPLAGQHQQSPSTVTVLKSAGAPETRPEHLKAKLHQYMQAHMKWRAQSANAAPLTPAQKWITLMYEEQVLDFITRLTMTVHKDLLRRHLGMPAATTVPHGSSQSAPMAFGSSALRGTSTTAASQPIASSMYRPLAAAGQAMAMAAANPPTKPRQQLQKTVQVVAIPAPAVVGRQGSLNGHGSS